MSDIVSPLLQWLNNNPSFAGAVTFTISAAESVAIIGTIVPGSIMMTALGALAGAGVIHLWSTIFWAILGAIFGDGISYWIGRYFKTGLTRMWPFRTHPSLLKSGEAFVHKYGAMSVFIGRFVGPVRALVPLAAGMLGMKPYQFIIANVASAIGWAPVYMLPGILLGAASTELPPDIAAHVMLVLLLIFLFILMCLWFVYKLLQLAQKQIDEIQTRIWRFLKNNRVLKFMTTLLKHYDGNKNHGQLNLFIYFIFAGVLFLTLAWYVRLYGADTLTINNVMFHLFRGLRTKSLDNVMIDITLLGQKQVIIPVVVVLFAWLLMSKRWRSALHALAVGVLAAGSVYVFKNIIQSPRPWGILQSPETFSMPSGHVTLATTVFMGYAFLVAGSMRARYRWMVYALGLMVILLVSISRLYLGAHWFTDVLASWLLSSAVLLFVIISYERRRERPLKPLSMTLVSLIALIVTFSFFHYRHFDQLKMMYTQVSPPVVTTSMNDWWTTNEQVSAYRVSLFGVPSERINIEWAGSLDDIENTLVREGWTNPPPRDLISTLHRIADIKSSQYLPMVSPQYLDRRPALIMVRQPAGEKGLLALRLWDANLTLRDNETKVWVGIIGAIPRSYSWLYKSRRIEITIDPALVFPQKTGSAGWQWKIMSRPVKGKQLAGQKIMLIRFNKTVHRKI